jgi:ABC-type lipoprotein export system ATPase subunit
MTPDPLAAIAPPRTEHASVAVEPVVRGHGLVKRFGSGSSAVEALRGVDVAFDPGTFTAIMGPSGSGKSTLLHILAGLDRATEGWVEIAGTRLDRLSDRDLTLLRRRQVGFVFQSYNLLPVLTGEENITLPFLRAAVRSRGGAAGRYALRRASRTITGRRSRSAAAAASRRRAPRCRSRLP